jgi:hypothetical protein
MVFPQKKPFGGRSASGIPEPPAVTVAARQVDLETTHPNDFAILVEAGSRDPTPHHRKMEVLMGKP